MTPKPPVRDWYDRLTVLLIIITIVVSLYVNYGTSTDMAKALNSMANMTAELRAQEKAMDNETTAMENVAAETRDVALAEGNQAKSVGRSVEFARKSAEALNGSASEERSGAVKITVDPIFSYELMNKFPTTVRFHFINVGRTTLERAKLAGSIGLFERANVPPSGLSRLPDRATETIPPQGDEPVAVRLPRQLTADIWQRLQTGDLMIVAVARISFRNKGERNVQVHSVCYAYEGPTGPPGGFACPSQGST